VPNYLVLDSNTDAEELTTKLYDARMDPEKRGPRDVTGRLVSVIEHPDTGEQAVPLADVKMPIRNPDPPMLPGGVDPTQAQGGSSDYWHERFDLSQWGSVKTRSEMEAGGWFPEPTL